MLNTQLYCEEHLNCKLKQAALFLICLDFCNTRYEFCVACRVTGSYFICLITEYNVPEGMLLVPPVVCKGTGTRTERRCIVFHCSDTCNCCSRLLHYCGRTTDKR